MTTTVPTPDSPPAAEEQPLPWLEEMPTAQIVAELDRYCVGQAPAKRSIAIAVRNRGRRIQAPDPMREEITPSNIILVGPTGVGKTEIARRLARLAGAPFVKVEASKFTEIGYARTDVTSTAHAGKAEAVAGRWGARGARDRDRSDTAEPGDVRQEGAAGRPGGDGQHLG